MQELDNYLREMDPKWQTAYLKLLNTLQEHIPAGFELVWQYEMPTFVVPLSFRWKFFQTAIWDEKMKGFHL